MAEFYSARGWEIPPLPSAFHLKKDRRLQVAEFYSARGWEIPPLPWTNLSPPFSGEIEFSPMIAERQWGEASIDLRLGYQITKFKDDLTGITVSVSQGLKSIGSMALWTTKTLKEDDGFGHPGGFCPPSSRVHPGAYPGEHQSSKKPDRAHRRPQHLRPGWIEHAPNCPLDSARMERSHNSRNDKSRAARHTTDTDGRPTLPGHLFPTVERSPGRRRIWCSPVGCIRRSKAPACPRYRERDLISTGDKVCRLDVEQVSKSRRR